MLGFRLRPPDTKGVILSGAKRSRTAKRRHARVSGSRAASAQDDTRGENVVPRRIICRGCGRSMIAPTGSDKILRVVRRHIIGRGYGSVESPRSARVRVCFASIARADSYQGLMYIVGGSPRTSTPTTKISVAAVLNIKFRLRDFVGEEAIFERPSPKNRGKVAS